MLTVHKELLKLALYFDNPRFFLEWVVPPPSERSWPNKRLLYCFLAKQQSRRMLFLYRTPQFRISQMPRWVQGLWAKMFELRPFLKILGHVIIELGCFSGFWIHCLRPLPNILLLRYDFPRCALNTRFFTARGTLEEGNKPSYPHLTGFWNANSQSWSILTAGNVIQGNQAPQWLPGVKGKLLLSRKSPAFQEKAQENST